MGRDCKPLPTWIWSRKWLARRSRRYQLDRDNVYPEWVRERDSHNSFVDTFPISCALCPSNLSYHRSLFSKYHIQAGSLVSYCPLFLSYLLVTLVANPSQVAETLAIPSLSIGINAVCAVPSGSDEAVCEEIVAGGPALGNEHTTLTVTTSLAPFAVVVTPASGATSNSLPLSTTATVPLSTVSLSSGVGSGTGATSTISPTTTLPMSTVSSRPSSGALSSATTSSRAVSSAATSASASASQSSSAQRPITDRSVSNWLSVLFSLVLGLGFGLGVVVS